MKQFLKKALAQAFESPPPQRKREFLRRLELPHMSTAEFLFTQLGYIRKRVWGVSAFIFGISLIGSVTLSLDMLWAISAFTPLLALSVLSESGRSEDCKMAELEMATRFSLRSVLFARSGILGAENLALLCLLVPFGLRNNTLRPIQAGAYILAPYLSATFIGLWIFRRFRGREAIYFCTGVTACISISVFFLHRTFPQIYQESCLVWWTTGIMLLCIGTAIQYRKIISDPVQMATNGN